MRGENETFDEYKRRRKSENLKLKLYLKGTLVWDSRLKGTYIKSKHGIL